MVLDVASPHDAAGPSPVQAPLWLHAEHVRPEWVDYNGHMSEAFYVLVFGHATDALLDLIGMDEEFRERSGLSMYTLEAHVRYLREAVEGDPLRVSTQVLGTDGKRAHLWHAMWHGDRGHCVATEELLICGVDVAASRSAPLPAEVASTLRAIVEAHEALPVDEHVGRAITLKR